MASPPLFPNYMQMEPRIHPRRWLLLRIVVVEGAIWLCALLVVRPQLGLAILWKILIPLLPLVFFSAPGVWRNVCPLAALNQTPRSLGFTRGLTQPKWLKDYAYVIGIALFVILVPLRKALFNTNGLASAVLILGALALAFLGGLVFKGKSGWCSSICPLLPVQRIYGQTPFAVVPNAHCRPCVGCTKNCYDFNPAVAQLADLYDDDPYYTGYRKLFAGMFPGFILAFYTVPNPPAISVPVMYFYFALYMLVSAGIYNFLDSFVKVSDHKLTALFAAVALNLYYGINFPAFFGLVTSPLNAPGLADALAWTARALLLAATALWVLRTFRKERLFVGQAIASRPLRVGVGNLTAIQQAAHGDRHEVMFMPEERRVLVEPERTLLEIAENSGLKIEAGCRMGVCGADPVAIVEGLENLSPLGDDERSTLERLGLGNTARMACQARVRGAVCVSLDLSQAKAPAAVASGFQPDTDVRSVVIIGNGIAGVTAADHIRRHHKECEIHIVGRERHLLYNRMAISRLIYGRSAMQGLYLMPDSWYSERDITCWLNTLAHRIDPQAKEVLLGTGESLAYDRLILAMGSRSAAPPVDGIDLTGSFVLREADDAMRIRAFAQEFKCQHAAIAGGGLLGLEAGYALYKLGMNVSILERGERLLRRQLDERSSELLRGFLEGLDIDIVLKADTAQVRGDGRVSEVVLMDGRTIPCDLFLACAGIQPNIELARDSRLLVNRGVIVDNHMRTSQPDIFAVGDLAEYDDEVSGLWPAAVEQGEVAALNAIGGDRRYSPVAPFTILKVVGIDLASIGQFEPQSPDDLVIVQEDIQENRYRKLVISGGKIVGAILLGYPLEAQVVADAVKQEFDVSGCLDRLRAGDWMALKELAVPTL